MIFVPSAVPAHGRLFVYDPFDPEVDRDRLRAAAQGWGLSVAGDHPGSPDTPDVADVADVADTADVADVAGERLPGSSGAGAAGGGETTVDVAVPGPDGPVLVTVPAVAVPLLAGRDARNLDALTALQWHGPSWRSAVPTSLQVWSTAARLADRLVASGRVLPDLVEHAGGVLGIWRGVTDGDDEAGAARGRLVHALPPAGYATPHPAAAGGTRVWDPDSLLGAFLDAAVDARVRCATEDPRPGRPRARILPWTARWAAAVTDPVDASVPLRDDASELVAGVAGWRGSLYQGDSGAVAVVRLHEPRTADGPWRVDLAVRSDDHTVTEAGDVWAGEGDDALQEALLAGLARCARVLPAMERLLDEQEPVGLDLDLREAWTFISEAAELLDGLVDVELPAEVREGDLRIRLRIGDPETGDVDVGADDVTAAPDAGAPPESGVLAGEESARWEVALGDDPLDDDQVAELLAAEAPLVHWRGRWVRVDPGVAQQVRELAPLRGIPLAEALGLALSGSAVLDSQPGIGAVEVVADGRVADLVARIGEAGDRPDVAAEPEGFHGALRPYQRRGLAWLQGMAQLGLGGVLADDMGLGKTVQLIAHLLARGGGPHLIVCPTSVLGNWGRELARFAPGLEVVRHHGGERQEDPYTGAAVVLTSYGTLRRDADQLAATVWDVVTLDEAQFVKNPNTAGARAVRRLRSRQTVAMTGTPLENRLSELWSLLDATNPGLVGTRPAFTRRYVTPIEQHRDRAAAGRLRRLVAPFVLRREKSDPAIAADLPDKIERTVVCPLTSEQAEAYQRAVDTAMADVAGLDGMRRRGRVLALLTQLKQLCNHPEPLRDRGGTVDVDLLTGRSGKLETARAIVAEAVGGGAQVLAFSQYVETSRMLARRLGADLGVDVPVLHGGLSASARDDVVAAFQGERGERPPVLVVSLRAGGTGLNLTAASHVLHYDRWWNPAVEDQATDRAHRIGQTRTVEVHKLVTAGTVEERIAGLLDAKRELADSVVGAGESWITELDDGQLSELVALARDVDVTDFDDDATVGMPALEVAS